ncbi:hypothetical protein L1885_26415, partial [Streptomyces fuscigenes]|nr:hypothetical protein [Streptomyces fuscigenes]
MNAMNADNDQRTGRGARQVRRAAVAFGIGGVLIAGVLVFVPDKKHEPPPLGGPEARALTAVTAGAPAAAADLDALVRDRTAWLRTHPADTHAWAVLGSAYVQKGVREADPGEFPRAQAALDRALGGAPAHPSGPASAPPATLPPGSPVPSAVPASAAGAG